MEGQPEICPETGSPTKNRIPLHQLGVVDLSEIAFITMVFFDINTECWYFNILFKNGETSVRVGLMESECGDYTNYVEDAFKDCWNDLVNAWEDVQ